MARLIRFILKDKISLVINVTGIGVAIASVLVILLFVAKERNYDAFHRNAENIYRLELENTTPTGVKRFVTTGPASGLALKESIPQIRESVLIKKGDEHLISHDNKAFFEDRLFYVSSSFFEVFDFELKSGKLSPDFEAPGFVILSEKVTTKFFGSEDPVGQRITIDGERSLEISGVFVRSPDTHFDIDFYVSFPTYQYPEFGSANSWTWVTFYNYLLLEENTTPESLEARIKRVADQYINEDRKDNLTFRLVPLRDIYLSVSPEPANEIGPTSNRLYSTAMAWFALFLLFIATINFLNLTLAQGSNRLREVGIKKYLGISRYRLIRQFLAESLVVNLIAFLFAVFLSYFFILDFGVYLNLDTTYILNFLPEISLAAIVLLFFLTCCAGIYPAIVLSKFKLIEILKPGEFFLGSYSGVFRKTLVGVQFGVSVLLIISSLVIRNQMEFVRTKDLGFEKEKVIIIPLKNESMRASYDLFRNRLEKHSEIVSVGAARLGLEGLHGSYQFVHNNNLNEAPRMAIYPVSYQFLETLQIDLLSGRSFDSVNASDTLHQFIMNERAARQMNWSTEEAPGQRGMLTGQGGIHGRVIGVVKDFHFEPLQHAIEPTILWLAPQSPYYVYIRTGTLPNQEILSAIEADFMDIYPDTPFEYEYLTDRLQAIYTTDISFEVMSSIFSIISIVICCMGLFGLTSFFVERKIREIGIRRVLGAGSANIFFLVNKNILLIVIVSTLIALPLGYLGVNAWLDNFAYSIKIKGWIFLWSILLSLSMMLLAVIYHTVRAIRMNPASILKTE